MGWLLSLLKLRQNGSFIILQCVCACACTHPCTYVCVNRDFGEHRATVGIQLLTLGRGSLLNQVDQPKVRLHLTRETRVGWWPSAVIWKRTNIPKVPKKREKERKFQILGQMSEISGGTKAQKWNPRKQKQGRDECGTGNEDLGCWGNPWPWYWALHILTYGWELGLASLAHRGKCSECNRLGQAEEVERELIPVAGICFSLHSAEECNLRQALGAMARLPDFSLWNLTCVVFFTMIVLRQMFGL